ncbi:MAG: hypothetical protein KDA17_06415, partial [Candidatus Saccharibacteria bacterium]|nr:hypothetical protein [Candidatus Saccharibacteria bacterium]
KKDGPRGAFKFFVVLGLFSAYLVFSVLSFGLKDGVLVALLSWSFFEFCTPIADAGFLLDFPIRLLTGFRMLYTELLVWVFAILINVVSLALWPATYDKTSLLHLFQQILTTPWPLGLIIVLSASGTYLSVYLGDDAFDIASAKNKQQRLRRERMKLLYSLSGFAVTVVLYLVLLRYTHIHIRL